MRRDGNAYLAGVLTGAAMLAVAWWVTSAKQRTPTEAAIYDQCLLQPTASTTSCEALLRTLEREQTAEAAMLKEAARLLSAGFTKREVVEWAAKRGFVGRQLSDAVGLSLEELQSGKY